MPGKQKLNFCPKVCETGDHPRGGRPDPSAGPDDTSRTHPSLWEAARETELCSGGFMSPSREWTQDFVSGLN
ncbi:hypothetical protein CgunFtcFv8_015951 [Champsocephalus gunnari]|uniref:Uncharacterized protein n=1 Tax=Champsocephalus gunnari TaxID=52237 RepID=A0AAN8C6R1_CHAGU|nr:hypothetical protein CgunFtcFv8_015951 [Champsocephalus gunnari]